VKAVGERCARGDAQRRPGGSRIARRIGLGAHSIASFAELLSIMRCGQGSAGVGAVGKSGSADRGGMSAPNFLSSAHENAPNESTVMSELALRPGFHPCPNATDGA
jgi:hypothetical protein